MHGRADQSCSCSPNVKAAPLASRLLSPGFHRGRPVPVRVSQKCRRRATRLLAGLSPDQLQDFLAPMSDHLFLAYERVVMPCHNMNCGDVVHRR